MQTEFWCILHLHNPYGRQKNTDAYKDVESNITVTADTYKVGLLQYGHLIQSLKIYQEKEDMKMGLGQVFKDVFHLERLNCANLEIAH